MDLNEIGEFIWSDNLFYAKKVTNEILQSVAILESFPFIGRKIEAQIHQLVNPKFKFKIVYRVEGEMILVLAIFREQENWN